MSCPTSIENKGDQSAIIYLPNQSPERMMDSAGVSSLGRRGFEVGFENSVYYDFMTFGAPHLGTGFSDWDILFAMQHYGLPTRLLDWSNSASVALYFALVTPRLSTCSAAIWVLDPFKLNKQAMSLTGIWHTKDLPYSYTEYFIEDETDRRKVFPGKVAAILPSKNNSRLLAQRAVFFGFLEMIGKLHRSPVCDVPTIAVSEDSVQHAGRTQEPYVTSM
jgi:FRG domain